MVELLGSVLADVIKIDKLYSVHYLEYPRNINSAGKRYDFWEVVYVDKGEVLVTLENKNIPLRQGNIIFHKPNEWHNLATSSTVSNVVIFTFDSTSPNMSFFQDKILNVGQYQKMLISKVLFEYRNTFSTPLNDLYATQLIKKESSPIGSEQLLNMYLCELLISFLRESLSDNQYSISNANNSTATLNMLINYMYDNISKSITMDDLVKYSGLNRTSITNIFNQSFNMSPIKYFNTMKIDLAKKYLRENAHNITQISEILGYSTVHYFSRQFKNLTGMSPIEYSHSFKAMTINL